MYQANPHMQSVSEAGIDERLQFIRRTYAHLFGAILAFAGVEFAIFSSGYAQVLTEAMLSVSWLLVLGVFMGVSWGADWLARSNNPPPLQYLGLAGFVVAEAIIFVPLLYIAASYSSPEVIPAAAVTTLIVFAGLTVGVFVTKKDFSFMRMGLMIAGLVAMGTVAAAIIFGFELGIFFSGAMVLFAACAILYQTSAVMRDYHPSQHVAASLALFSSVALMFWYVLRIFMARD